MWMSTATSRASPSKGQARRLVVKKLLWAVVSLSRSVARRADSKRTLSDAGQRPRIYGQAALDSLTCAAALKISCTFNKEQPKKERPNNSALGHAQGALDKNRGLVPIDEAGAKHNRVAAHLSTFVSWPCRSRTCWRKIKSVVMAKRDSSIRSSFAVATAPFPSTTGTNRLSIACATARCENTKDAHDNPLTCSTSGESTRATKRWNLVTNEVHGRLGPSRGL